MNRSYDLIIPLYNKENSIKKTILGAINQNKKFNKIIVVDDGSTDKSKEILKELADKYDKIEILEQENQGVSFSRNRGAYHSKAEYIVFLDADDILDENYLENIEILVSSCNSKINIFSAKHYISGEEKKKVSNKKFHTSNYPILHYLLNKKIICASGICIKKKIFENYSFKNGVKTGEDINFFLEIFSRESLSWVNDYLIFVNKESENRSEAFWEIPYFLKNKKKISKLYKNFFSIFILEIFFLKNFYTSFYKIKLFHPHLMIEYEKVLSKLCFFEKAILELTKLKIFRKIYLKYRN